MYTLAIQPDFYEAISDVSNGTLEKDQFWINIFNSSKPLNEQRAKDVTLNVSKEGDEVVFEAESLNFSKIKEKEFRVEYEGESFVIKAPSDRISTGLNNATSFDISPAGGLFAIGDSQGSVSIGGLTDPNIEQKIENAHSMDVTHTRFFPSGQVVLTVSLDLHIKLWDIASGTNPRTFMSHKQRITDIAMIDKGRNFISSSLDGTVKLWDCASGSSYHTMKRTGSLNDGVTSLRVCDAVEETASSQSVNYKEEFGTQGKQVYAGYNSGIIAGFDLRSKKDAVIIPSVGSSVSEILSENEKSHNVLSVYSEGTIAKWDTRSLTEPTLKTKLYGGTVGFASSFSNQLTISNEIGLSCLTIGENFENHTISAVSEDPIVGIVSSKAKSYVSTSAGDIYMY